jgi:hypothetical protein
MSAAFMSYAPDTGTLGKPYRESRQYAENTGAPPMRPDASFMIN